MVLGLCPNLRKCENKWYRMAAKVACKGDIQWAERFRFNQGEH